MIERELRSLMKIKEFGEFVGGLETIRVLDDEYNELVKCGINDLPEEVGKKFVKTLYTSHGIINIIALDKRKRKWYNRGGNIAR